MIRWVFLLFFFAALSVPAVNVVVNGDMEKGVKPWQPYRGNWREPYCKPVRIPCSDSGHGKYAMLIEAEDSVRAAGINCEVKLPAAERKFWISAQIKLEKIKNGWVQIVLERRVKLPDGKLKRIKLWGASSVPTSRGGSVFAWREYSGEFALPENLPAGRDFLTLRLGGAEVAGRVLFDNVAIEPMAAKNRSAVQALQSTKPSGGNLIREFWSTSTYPGCWPLKHANGRFFADIPAGKRSVWHYTVYSIYDNIQGPMRFSFKSRYPLKAVLRCTLFPTEKKNDIVHRAQAVGKADAEGYKLYQVDFTPLPRTGRMYITLEAGKKTSASAMDFKEVRLERMVPADGKLSLYKVRHGKIEDQGLFLKSEPAYSVFQIENASAEKRTLPVKITVCDFYGKKVFDAVKKFSLPAQSITGFKVEYPKLEKLGFYSVAASWNDNGSPGNYRGGFVVVDEPLARPDKMFSFSAWDSDLGWENIKAQRRIGSGLKGVAFFGRVIESGNFRIMEKTLAAAERNNMEIIGTIPLPPGRFMPNFKPDMAKLKAGKMPYNEDYFQHAHKHLTALAKKYKGRIKYWILYDELDCSVLRYPYAEEHFIKAVKTASNAFRAVDKDFVITSLTVTGHDNKAVPRYPLLRKVWPQVREYLDGLSLDAYSSGNTFGPNWEAKDPVNGEFKEIVQSAYNIAKADGKKRLSIQERGYARSAMQPIDGVYAINEAKALAADFVIAKSMPELEFLLYYNWRAGNDGPNREFGVVMHENARPVAAVYAAAARRLAHVKFIKQLQLNYQALQSYVFKRGNTAVVPIWISAQPTDFDIAADFRIPAVDDLKAFDMQGNEVPLKSDGKYITLKLTAAPLYLETSQSEIVMEKALKQGSCQLPEVAMDMTVWRGSTVRSYVKNLTGSPLKTDFVLKVNNSEVTRSTVLPPLAVTPVDFSLKNNFTAGTLHGKLQAVTAGGSQYTAVRDMDVLPLRKAGSFDDLEKRPALVKMDGRSYINDLDSVANKVWADNADCSADVRIGYNPRELLLSVTVRDEKHIAPWNGKGIWKGDCIQVAFETARDAVKRKLLNRIGFIGTDRLYTAALVNNAPEMFMNPATAGKTRAQIKITRNEAAGTTVYRLAVPWSELSMQPSSGAVVGFALLIADSDWEKRQFQYRLELGHGIDGAFHDPSRLLSLIIE